VARWLVTVPMAVATRRDDVVDVIVVTVFVRVCVLVLNCFVRVLVSMGLDEMQRHASQHQCTASGHTGAQ